MNIAIVGYDREGRASHAYYAARGHSVSVFDANQELELPENTSGVIGAGYLETVKDYDVVLRTPGLYPAKLISAGVEPSKIWSGTNEFFNVCPTKNIIGVTGTKGKGTTSSLIAKMLQNAGYRVHLGGNIGTPALDLLKNDIKPEDWVVLELSNFQLIDLQSSPHIAVCLLIVPEHLDWHTDEAEYVGAKKNIFAHQNPEDFAVYFANNDNSTSIAQSSAGTKLAYFSEHGAHVENDAIVIDTQEICKTSEIALLGEHNWQNVCAAVTAVWNVTHDTNALQKAITEFTGLEHRIEYVKTVNGVKFYNDSFATTPEATIAAIRSFTNPKILILGGTDKGADFSQLASVIAESKVRKVILIGNTSHQAHTLATPRIATALQNAGVDNVISLAKEGVCTMNEIAQTAISFAEKDDVILLSTASASFDMFTDYKDRGNQFKNAVKSLDSTS
jgi:UDP-N-acetylmuramoylalanine--D-glutamate ligase